MKTSSLASGWQYDRKSIAYRHGGAGNNWSLGYSMASGEFLDLSLDCIRRQIERADNIPCLLLCHSLAGGTGSGLGTHLTECIIDEFTDLTTNNLLIAPHHFGEVVVQHYNALLCLSKLSNNVSQSLILLENEMVQILCRTMYGIEQPQLHDLNHVLANHIVPAIYLPKIISSSSSYSSSSVVYHTKYHSFLEDVIALTAHPWYRFLNIKFSPQTSKKSVEHTFDQWPTLLKMIQRMQLGGSFSERMIPAHIKCMGRSSSSYGQQDYISPTAAVGHDSDHHHNTIFSPSRSTTEKEKEKHDASSARVYRSLGSIISCHGESAASYCEQVQQELLHHYSNSQQPSAEEPVTTRTTPTKTFTNRVLPPSQIEHIFSEYYQSHSSLQTYSSSSSTSSLPVQCNYTNFLLHQYQRSAHVISNDQSILPLMTRTLEKSHKMFQSGAYLHQYSMYGLEYDDFQEAFYNLSTVIKNYESI